MAEAITAGQARVGQPAWLTVLRVALGLILIWKGIAFIRDTATLKSLVEQTGVGLFTQNAGALALIVTILTLLCGFFITVGLLTRWAAMVQIPVVLVALVFINLKNFERNGFEAFLSIVVLALLVLFSMKGSGALSADEYFRRGAAVDKDSDRPFR